MTEGELLKIAGEKLGEWSCYIAFHPALYTSPYFCAVKWRGKEEYSHAKTIVDALQNALAKHGLRIAPNGATSPGPLFNTASPSGKNSAGGSKNHKP